MAESEATIIGKGMSITGKIRARQIEVHGELDAEVVADRLTILPGGRCRGEFRLGSADVAGELRGRARVQRLLNIRSAGTVAGQVEYGQLALETGGILQAEMRNVPPELAGDLDLTVPRGGSAAITADDLSAIDPDDAPQHLTFRVSRPLGGHVAARGAPQQAVSQFTLADVQAGRVIFQHDGSSGSEAGFEILVTDRAGATSGARRRVTIDVQPAARAAAPAASGSASGR